VDYFAELLKTNVEGARFSNRVMRSIDWKNSGHYKQMAMIFRSEIERAYAELNNRLVERELLSVAEAESLTPKIVVRVADVRNDKRVKLPEIPGEVKSSTNDR
jgi:hypothetical protein